MNRFQKKWLAVACIIGILFPLTGICQSILLETDTIPLNPAIRHGILSNGLQYYIMRDGSKEKNTIDIRLVVNIGTRDEDADQLNMAHLVEHLGFKTTEHFPMGVRNYFQSKGLIMGTSFNGITRLTNTDYFFTIPSDDSLLLSKCFLALHDFASGILFLPTEVEEARNEVINEYSRLIIPSSKPMDDLLYRQSGRHSRFKPGLLNEEMQNARLAPIDALIRFYRDWYHPMHQAVFIVGNIDESKVEKQVKALFSNLSNTGARKKETSLKSDDIKLSGKDKLLIVDPLDGSSKINIAIYKKRKGATNYDAAATFKEYKLVLMRNLVREMMDHRRQSFVDRKITSPHLSLVDLFGDGIEAIAADNISVNNGHEIKAAIVNGFREFKRIEKYGFSEIELIRAKDVLMASIIRKSALPFDIHQLVYHYVDDKAVPANEEELAKELLVQITLKDVNAMVKTWLITDGNTDIVIKAPEIKHKELPKEESAFLWMQEALKSKVSPYVAPMSLVLKPLATLPVGEDIGRCTITELDSLDAKKIVLPNGATVFIKSIPSSNRHRTSIQLNGLSKTNVSESKLDEESLVLLKNVSNFTGIGSINTADLEFWKQDRGNKDSSAFLDVKPYILPYETGISAQGKAESVLQLVNLYMTKGMADEQAYKSFCKSYSEEALSPKRPFEIFADTIAASMGFHSVIIHGLSGSRSKLEEVYRIYKKEFSNAANFTFVITGSFDQDEMLKLIARYIGALPGSKATLPTKHLARKQPGAFFGKERHVVLVDDSTGNVFIEMLFKWKCELNPKSKLALDVLAAALQPILLNRLRYKENGVYELIAGKRTSSNPNEFFLNIFFQSAPENVDRLQAAVEDELRRLTKGEWESDIFNNAVESVRLKYAGEMKSSSFWANYFIESIHKGKLSMDPIKSLHIPDMLTPSDLTSVITNCLHINDYMIFKLL